MQRQSFLLVPNVPALTFHEWKEKYRKLGIVADAQIWLPRHPCVCILNYDWLDLKQLMNKNVVRRRITELSIDTALVTVAFRFAPE